MLLCLLPGEKKLRKKGFLFFLVPLSSALLKRNENNPDADNYEASEISMTGRMLMVT
jgi:hypothetical protein